MRTLLAFLLCASAGFAHQISVSETRFLLDGKPFPFHGLTFFHAVYNQAFNRSPAERRAWLEKFGRYKIDVLRVWAQWDSRRAYADVCDDCTLYYPDGRLREGRLKRLKEIIADADSLGMVMELVLFAQEIWHAGVRLEPAAPSPPSRASFCPSPQAAGRHHEALDYLTPHTSRQNAGRHWEIAPRELAYLLARYRKPVVDNEPARNGAPDFGGPGAPTYPFDHMIQMYQAWQLGVYTVYRHDMFQDRLRDSGRAAARRARPRVQPYRRLALDFFALRDRYWRRDR